MNNNDSISGDIPVKVFDGSMVLTWFLSIIKALCCYYIPMSASVLWWVFGVGSLLTGSFYLRYLWSTHFIVDAQIAVIAERSWCSMVQDTCTIPCYHREAQDAATFFAVVVTHAIIEHFIPSIFNCIIFIVAFCFYMVLLISSSDHHKIITLLALLIGAVVGVAKVIFFAKVVLFCKGVHANNTTTPPISHRRQQQQHMHHFSDHNTPATPPILTMSDKRHVILYDVDV